MSRRLYLKPSVQMEPLICRWYAWSHLISPATAALNIAKRHIPIMESYIADPAVHADAVAEPAMLGGPFVDYGGKREDEVEVLLNATRRQCAKQIELSNAILELNTLLRRAADGRSLEPLYSQVPLILRGLVELVYDTDHNPSVRYLEPLMYHSNLYNSALQGLAFSHITSDDRKFIMSTPRLDDEKTVITDTPFASEEIDDLFAMRTTPGYIDRVAHLFSGCKWTDRTIDEFFTLDAPRHNGIYDGGSVRVRYFGHACVLVEAGGTSILVDPVISYDYDSNLPRFTYLDLPEHIDCVLLTHNHQDHVMLETLLQIRHRVGQIIVPNSGSGAIQEPSLSLMLRILGFKNVVRVDMLDEIAFAQGTVVAVPFLGEHSDLRIDGKTAYVVSIYDRKILLGADSRVIEPAIYERILPVLEGVDTVFMGMECEGAPLSWLYGPLLTRPLSHDKDQSRTLSGSDSAMVAYLVRLLKPKRMFVYAMGQEPWLNHVMCLRYTDLSVPIVESNKLLEAAQQAGAQAERLFGSREIYLN